MNKLLLCIICLVYSVQSFAQYTVSINAQVVPPYSPYISTYVDNPNKLILTLTNTSAQQQNIKLWVRIAGDNGVSGTTANNFKPLSPIVLPPYQTKIIDFSSSETKSYFDANNITLVGITKAQLIQNQALPEGSYTICVKALDYNTSQPLSIDGQGCTAPFNVSYIDPCLTIQPACGSEIQQTNPQNILFTWTPPATAPGNLQYEFTLKEVLNNLNPNDVIKNAAFPVIYSGTFTGATSLLYTNALPQLIGGRKYVWRIKCIDPTNSVQFKNNGYSQACTFNYKAINIAPPIVSGVPNSPQVTTFNIDYTKVPTTNQGNIFLPPMVLLSNVNGQLFYNWNSGVNKNYPMRNATIRLVVKYFLMDGGTEMYVGSSLAKDGIADGSELAVTKTDDNGNFNFNFAATFPFGKIADKFTAGSGEFKWTGTLYRKAVVEILYPHNQYYFNPPQSVTPIPGETVSFNSLVAPVKTCKLEVTIERYGGINNQLYGTSNTTLPDAKVYLCRKPIPIFFNNSYPQDDGLPKNFTDKPDALSALEIVAQAKTNSKGKAVFERVSYNSNTNYQYFIYAEFDKNATGFYNYTSSKGPEKFSKQTLQQGTSFDIVVNPGSGETYFQTLKMNAELPRVAGVMIDKFDGKPQAGIATLNSFYIAGNESSIAYNSKVVPDEKLFANTLNACSFLCSKLVKRYYFVGKSGDFSFNNLSILYNKADLKPIGPLHVLTTKSVGYSDAKHAVPEVLFFGSQHYAEIKLDRGGAISGKIVDGETGKGLAANFYFLGENNAGQCNYNGYFNNYPARKMQDKQKLIISYPGYITDTVEVLVDKSSTNLGTLKIYTINRRLSVYVSDAETGKSIENATVQILGVTTFCNTGSGQFKILAECPLAAKTAKLQNMFGLDLAMAKFSFKNAGGQENNAQVYQVKILAPANSNYETKTISTTIPYSSTDKYLDVKLKPATCVSGYVYAGKGSGSPVQGAKVKMDVTTTNDWWWGGSETSKIGEEITTTDANGYYELKNVPLRSYPQTIRAFKGSENLIGDSFTIVTQPSKNSSYYNFNGKNFEPSNSYGNWNFNYNGIPGQNNTPKCISHNFNLAIYNGIDLSSLMGFPIEVTSLKPYGSNGAIIDGYFVSFNNNNQFATNSKATLQFKSIKVLPSSTIKNEKGIPAATPETTPITTENNMLPLQLYNTVDGMVEDKKLGIYLDKDVGGKQYGVIKGRVKILNTAFNQSVIAFSDTFFLALPNETSISKLTIPVLNADKNIKEPADAPTGFKISNSEGNPVKFSLPGFPNTVLSDYNASIFFKGELNLTARIQTNIADILPSNLDIKLSNIKLKKGINPTISSATPVSFNMGNWKLSSSDFSLDENGLKLNKGTIEAGVTIPFSNLGVRYNQLLTNFTDIQLDNMKLAGVHPVDIVSTNKTFGLVNISGGKKAWKIYLGPTPDLAATISNLPALGTTDKVELSSISLMSNGAQLFTLRSKPVTLRNILKFTPLDGTYISASENQFLFSGLFQLNLPDPKSFSTTLAFERSGSSLNFNMVNTQIVSFYKPTLLEHKFNANPTLTDGKFIYNGTSQEAGAFPSTKTTLYYTKDSVSVWIDKGQDILIKSPRKFANAEGGTRIENGNWTPFWFSGDMEGMAGISDKPINGKKQRMKFFVNGAVTADAQSLSVKNVETPFGNMSWVYEFPNSRLTGHMDVDMGFQSTTLKGQINSIVDGSGWFFGADGEISLNGIGNVQFAGLFGNYPTYPSGVKLSMGDFKCLPPAFNSKVEGIMLQAGLHKDVLPEIKMGIPGLLDVSFGVDVGITTRLWKSFSETGNELGISLLARGHAFANGSCGVTCSSVGADANAEVSIKGTYNGTTGSYGFNGCGSFGFNLKVEQCLGALGLCSDACLGINTGQIDVGLNMEYNSSSGADLGIQFQSCSSVCD